VFVLENITKIYHHRQEPVHALHDISMTIQQGSFVAITGSSGSGKTTLLLTLGGLIHPTSGEVNFKGTSLYKRSDNHLAAYRNQTVGFVLQTFNLVPYLTAMENVMVPMLAGNHSGNDRRNRAMRLLDKLGLAERTDFLPRELSIGQQQRVAIARALANDPEVILADEPTGNLDPVLSFEILDILRELNEKEGRTVLMVTHNPEAAREAKRILQLKDGRLCKKTVMSYNS
jgi:putative ABC transport system ATP-binding protein